MELREKEMEEKRKPSAYHKNICWNLHKECDFVKILPNGSLVGKCKLNLIVFISYLPTIFLFCKQDVQAN